MDWRNGTSGIRNETRPGEQNKDCKVERRSQLQNKEVMRLKSTWMVMIILVRKVWIGYGMSIMAGIM